MISTARRQPAVRTFSTNAGFIEGIGRAILRYGLVLLLIGSGMSKFTEFEARWIEPLMANSPFFGWLYGVTSV
jgi:uncharacterized membrane protein YkgB